MQTALWSVSSRVRTCFIANLTKWEVTFHPKYRNWLSHLYKSYCSAFISKNAWHLLRLHQHSICCTDFWHVLRSKQKPRDDWGFAAVAPNLWNSLLFQIQPNKTVGSLTSIGSLGIWSKIGKQEFYLMKVVWKLWWLLCCILTNCILTLPPPLQVGHLCTLRSDTRPMHQEELRSFPLPFSV